MGLEPFLITATVEGILAQRLVRQDLRGLPHRVRAERRDADGAEPAARGRRRARSSTTAAAATAATTPATRAACGIYELVVMNDELRDLISAGASTDELRNACRKHGHGDPARVGPATRSSTASPPSKKWCARRCWKMRVIKIESSPQRSKARSTDSKPVQRGARSVERDELGSDSASTIDSASMRTIDDSGVSDADLQVRSDGHHRRRRSRTPSRPPTRKKPSRRSGRWATS